MVIADMQSGQVVDHVRDRSGQTIGRCGDTGGARRPEYDGSHGSKAAWSAAPAELRNAL
jgi:hypothetical protein